MKNLQAFSDWAAIALSLLCAIHCLVLPLALIALPSFAALKLNDEAFHLWMLVAVIPTSTYALSLGCKTHKGLKPVALGLIGLFCLILALFAGHDLLGETGEKALTVTGAVFMVFAHSLNFQLCQKSKICTCT